jgi:hypothetical protein
VSETEKLDCCPYCGSDIGYYKITRMKGLGQTNYGFNGTECDNSELHECLIYKENKTTFCCQCHHKLTGCE